jgi:C4-dicarboxylate-specific signal transduction histidine kinase
MTAGQDDRARGVEPGAAGPWRLSAWFARPGRARAVALLAGLLLAAGFLTLFMLLGERERRTAMEEARRDVAGVLASVVDQLSRALETTDILLIEMARGIERRGAPWEIDRVAMRLAQLPHLRAALVTDAGGRVVFSTEDSLLGQEVAGRPWLRPAPGGASQLVVGSPEPGRFLARPGMTIEQAGRWHIPVLRPLVQADGTQGGFVIALMNPEYLIAIGQRAAVAFDVSVRFHHLNSMLLARSDGRIEGIGTPNPGAWLFRDFLPRLDAGLQDREDSAGQPATAAFGVTATGMMVVEVSRSRDVILGPVLRHRIEVGAGIAVMALATLACLAIMIRSGRLVQAQQDAARAAEERHQTAARETALLRSSRAETTRLLDGVPVLMFQIELQAGAALRYRRIGGDVEAVTGWPEAVIEAPGGWAAARAPETDGFDDFMRLVAAKGRAEREYSLRQPDGGSRWLRTVAAVTERRLAGGLEIVGYTVDVSAERERAGQLAAAGRLASLGEMATGLAHELRQPLTIMSLAAQNLQKALDSGRLGAARQRIERIVEQSARAGNIIEHLRRFARGSEEAAPPEPVALDAAVAGALTLVGGSLRDADVIVQVDLGETSPVVLGHLVGLEQVLVNLLMNACHAMEGLPPGLPRRIALTLGATPPGGCVDLALRDTGGGIAPKVLARIFEPFVTTKGVDKGTGLGLSICHGLVKAMGGSIAARNEGEGAVFTITLRLASEGGAECPPFADGLDRRAMGGSGGTASCA